MAAGSCATARPTVRLANKPQNEQVTIARKRSRRVALVFEHSDCSRFTLHIVGLPIIPFRSSFDFGGERAEPLDFSRANLQRGYLPAMPSAADCDGSIGSSSINEQRAFFPSDLDTYELHVQSAG
jgi:hypothetical protein